MPNESRNLHPNAPGPQSNVSEIAHMDLRMVSVMVVIMVIGGKRGKRGRNMEHAAVCKLHCVFVREIQCINYHLNFCTLQIIENYLQPVRQFAIP